MINWQPYLVRRFAIGLLGLSTALLYACVSRPPVDHSKSKITPITREKLVDLSLKELIHIPLNKDYSQHTIHQSDQNQVDEQSLNFGIMAPISEFPLYSAEIIAASDLAAAFVNQQGGVNGRRLVILRADDNENTPVSAALAKELVEGWRVEAIIGPATSDSVADVLEKVTIPHEVPLISQSASSSLLSEIGGAHQFWRMVANNQQQINLMNRFLDQQLGHQRVFLINGRDIYSQEIAAGIKGYFKGIKNGKVEQLSISNLVNLTTMDLKPEIESMQQAGTTAIVLTLVNAQVKDMIKKIQQHWQGKFPIILVGDTVTPKYLVDADLGDISACIFSYVGSQKDLKASFNAQINRAIATEATGFDGAYVFDATMILSMAKVLAEQFNLPFKEAVSLITDDGHPVKYTDFAKLPDLYREHKRFSYYGYSGRVQFNERGDNLTAFTKIYSLAKDPEKTRQFCIEN